MIDTVKIRSMVHLYIKLKNHVAQSEISMTVKIFSGIADRHRIVSTAKSLIFKIILTISQVGLNK